MMSTFEKKFYVLKFEEQPEQDTHVWSEFNKNLRCKNCHSKLNMSNSHRFRALWPE